MSEPTQVTIADRVTIAIGGGPPGATGVWGGIVGDIETQDDLKDALDLKFDIADISAAGQTLVAGETAAAQRATLGATTVGSALFTAANPSAIAFPRVNADNTVTLQAATDYLTSLGGTAAGKAVFTGANAAAQRTSLGATDVGSSFFTTANPSAISFPLVNADNTVAFQTASAQRTSLGATTVGSSFFTTANPSAITFPRVNANNTVTFQAAADYLTDIGAFPAAGGTLTNLTVSNALTLTGGIFTPQLIVTASYQILATDQTIIANSATPITITLPAAVVTQSFHVKNVNAGTVTLEGAGSDTLDGSLNQPIHQWDSLHVACYESGKWAII